MVITLLIWICKKYLLPRARRISLSLNGWPARRNVWLLAFVLLACPAAAQHRQLLYRVMQNGNEIGRMRLDQKQENDDLYIHLSSEVKVRFLFSVVVNMEESSHYRDGKLLRSNVNHKVNNKEKAVRCTMASGRGYQTSAEGRNSSIGMDRIEYNVMLLYSREPVNATQIYSDNFQQFLNIRKAGSHSYRIDLPDGNYNTYSFNNGICNRVEIHHTLYTVEMILI